jgi:geranylgeranyl pyrophosphate synthase
MSSTLVEETIDVVLDRVRSAIDETDPRLEVIRSAMDALCTTREPERAVVALPVVVTRVEGGLPERGVAVAAVHHLWWLAAHVFDDVIDDGDLTLGGALSPASSVMAAAAASAGLALTILHSDLPECGAELAQEYAGAWLMSNDGQIRDTEQSCLRASVRDVLTTYVHKNGAAFGAACSMAAAAAGAEPARVALWRSFGCLLGAVGQLRNDEEDLVTDRNEDLRNGTATYLTAVALRGEHASQLRVLLDGDSGACPEGHLSAARALLRSCWVEGALAARRQQWRAELREHLDELAPAVEERDVLESLVAESTAPVEGCPSWALDTIA